MLEIRDLDVYHGDLKALWSVTLDVKPGEMLPLIGSNGAGKSTLLETIAGLLVPASGIILFEGMNLNHQTSHRIVELGVSLVPEDRGIFPFMSVMENLELGAFNKRGRKLKEETLAFVHGLFPLLKERTSQAAGTLSGGEQQMLAIGKGLLSKPKLLMLDEPSIGLAPLVVKNIFEAIQQINEIGVSILLVEQNVRIALSIAQRAYILENGRIVHEGDTQHLLSDDHVRRAYLGTTRISRR